MLHAAPAEIGHVHQAVHAADVDERAEVRQAANGALDDGADLEGVPQLLLAGRLFHLQNLLAGSNDALLGLVDLDDLQGHGLAHELVDLLNIAQGELGCGNEGANAHDVRQQAALDGFLADALNEFAGFLLRNDLFPSLAVDDVLLGEQHVALAVVHLHNLDFDFVADLDIGRGKIRLLYETVSLVSNVDAYFVFGDLNHGTSDDLAGAELNKRFLNVFHGHYGLFLGVINGYFLLDVVHSCNNLLNYTIRCGCTGCNPNNIGCGNLELLQLLRGFDEQSAGACGPGEPVQLCAVGALPAAHDDHHVRALCELRDLALAVLRGGADRGPDIRAADPALEQFTELVEAAAHHGGLADDQRALHLGQRLCVLRAHHGTSGRVGPAQNAHNLGMLPLAHDDHGDALLRGRAHHLVNAGYEGAGGVQDLATQRLERLDLPATHAVGANHHAGAPGDVLQCVHAGHALARELFHHLRIVDDRAESNRRCSCRSGIHRPSHAEAEARVPGKQDLSDRSQSLPFSAFKFLGNAANN